MQIASVITNAVSPDAYFPLWHSYYGKNFGFENLYVITNSECRSSFSKYRLGGVWEINGKFDEASRVKVASALVSALLLQSRFVLNVDTDEFAVPNPERYSSLSNYVQKLTKSYVTAMGMNVMQLTGEESEIQFCDPILGSQRRWVVPRSSLNKTCLVSEPTNWGPGFHWCSHFPRFDDLFLFHFKYADEIMRANHNQRMTEMVAGDIVREKYFAPNMDVFHKVRRQTEASPVKSGVAELYRHAFNQEFISKMEWDKRGRVYAGKDIHETVRIELSSDFASLL